VLIRGTQFFDELIGTSDADSVYGLGDDDQLFLGLGDDAGFGGTGNDVIDGSEGDDYLAGGANDDLLFGGSGADFLAGGRGADALWGGEGIDHLEGSTGNDYLNGHGLLLGGRGDDYLYTDQIETGAAMVGGKGHDAFVVNAIGDGATTFSDVLDFGQGDSFAIWADFTPLGGTVINDHDVFEALDANGDHNLSGADGFGAIGGIAQVGADLHVWLGDDAVFFRNVQALTDGQLYG
jgi:Ca2+-binding RTX toxin-like protein